MTRGNAARWAMPVKLCAVLVIAGWAVVAEAAPVVMVIEDQNSTARIDPFSDGMISWVVDGTQHLWRQWFWYRLEGMGQELPLNNLGFLAAQTSDTNFLIDPRDDTLTAYYGNLQQFYVVAKFGIQGGLVGSNSSDMAEQIAFHNMTSQTVKLWFFEYVNFDLNGTAGDDTVRIQGGNTAIQTDVGATVSETVVVTMPARLEANFFSNTLDSLNDAGITVLNGNGGPLTGDVTWAFEWYLEVPAGGSLQISKDKNLIPEPGMLSLMVLGGLALIRRRMR